MLHAYMMDPPSKILEYQGASELFQLTLYTYCHTSLLGELSVSPCDSTERDTWKLAYGFSWTILHVPFPFAAFDLYPSTVITIAMSIIAF